MVLFRAICEQKKEAARNEGQQFSLRSVGVRRAYPNLGNMEDVEDGRPRDDEILAHQQAVCAEVAKFDYIGDKEPLTVLAAEYELGNPVFKAKIEKLGESYSAVRRTRGDGNCFFRSFMFSYLEYVLETANTAEVARILNNVEQCRKSLLDLGYAEFTFEDFLGIFVEQLESVSPGKATTICIDTLVERCRDRYISDYVVMFFRFVTSSEIRKRSDFFEPFIDGMANMTVEQFCKVLVEPMGEESDHVHITALTDALGVPVRVVYLDRSIGEDGKNHQVNHHDFIPVAAEKHDQANADQNIDNHPPVVLLYRPGHYDILYCKK